MLTIIFVGYLPNMPITRRDVFQAIADPNRRAIINLIAFEPLNLNSIADNFEISRPAISQHIKILKECGLISVKRVGRESYCEGRLQKLNEVSQWIEQYRKTWEGRFDRMDRLLNDMKNSKKK